MRTYNYWKVGVRGAITKVAENKLTGGRKEAEAFAARLNARCDKGSEIVRIITDDWGRVIVVA